MGPASVRKTGKKLVIVGANKLADIAYDYFTNDSEYEVVGFAVDREYLKKTELFGLPVVPLDEATKRFPPATHHAYVAIFTTSLNKARQAMTQRLRAMGYVLASYVSSQANVARTAKVAEACTIFPMATILPFADIGEGVIVGPGAIVAHHVRVAPFAFIAFGSMIGGDSTIGERTFVGAGSIVTDEVQVGSDCLIGAGTCIRWDVEDGKVYSAPKPTEKSYTGTQYFADVAASRRT